MLLQDGGNHDENQTIDIVDFDDENISFLKWDFIIQNQKPKRNFEYNT